MDPRNVRSVAAERALAVDARIRRMRTRADSRDQNEEHVVVFDFVDDAVVAGADSPLAGAANEPGCGRLPGFGSEQLKCCLDASTCLGVEFAQLARCRRC